MWGLILSKLSEAFFSYLIMPLFSKALVAFQEWLQKRKQEQLEENKQKENDKLIDEAIQKFKEAKTNDEKKAAFRDIARLRRVQS